MNPSRTYEENMAALKKVLTQRTYTALSHRNIEFVLKYQNATTQELAAYLRRQQAELRHIPGRTEIIGGDFIELRFRGWVNALEAIGVSRELAAKRSTPALEKTALFQAEFNTQRELDKAAKAEAKKQNKAKEKPQIQGKGRRFRADLLLDEKITGRTMYALELQGFKCPQNKNVRKTQEFRVPAAAHEIPARAGRRKGSQARSAAGRAAGTGCGGKHTIIYLHNPNWERICI